jgi:hypothetical protein
MRNQKQNQTTQQTRRRTSLARAGKKQKQQLAAATKRQLRANTRWREASVCDWDCSGEWTANEEHRRRLLKKTIATS